MGKLHGLTIGLDICSTLHMEVTLDDLDWCIEQVMPANPAYLMALPTKNDPMLSYLTTAFQDHVRVREQVRLQGGRPDVGVLPEARRHRRRRRADRALRRSALGLSAVPPRQARRARPDAEILAEADASIARVRGRGVFAGDGPRGEAVGHGSGTRPAGAAALRGRQGRASTPSLPASFPATLASAVPVATRSRDRDDYILHPPTGEMLDEPSLARVTALRDAQRGALRRADCRRRRAQRVRAHRRRPSRAVPRRASPRPASPQASGRRRSIWSSRAAACAPATASARSLFGGLAPAAPAALVHVIGERPGNGHHTFSSYVTRLPARVWARPGVVDHNHTKVISNIADTALDPALAARQTVALLRS